MNKKDQLRAEAETLLAGVKAVGQKCEAEGRGFSPEEKAQVATAMGRAKALKAQADALQGDEDLIEAVKDFGRKVDLTPNDGDKAQSWGDVVVEAAKKASALTGAYGVKAVIAAGSVAVASPARGIVRKPAKDLEGNRRGATFLHELLPYDRIQDTDRFSYWRQTVRTNNAAPVAPGDLKPTSVFTIARVEDRVRTIAHLSEPIHEADLADFGDLKGFIDAEMTLGLQREITSQVLSGDGTGENLTGMRSASGIQTHSRAADDLFTAMRKAQTKLQSIGEVTLDGSVWVMHPNDAEDFDLLKDDNGRFYFEGPTGDAEFSKLWRVPVVITKEQPEGEQLLFDLAAVELVEREAPQIAIGQPGDLFQRNQVQIRAEGRYGLKVKLPSLIVKITA